MGQQILEGRQPQHALVGRIQIAAAAGNLADLAGNLETTAATAKDRY